MPDRKPDIGALIAQARQNDEHLDALFGWYRPYLRLKALCDPRIKRLAAKLDASDIAQDALRRAAMSFSSFRGEAEPQFSAWLQQIMRNSIEDAVRAYYGPTRDVTREQAMGASDGSASLVFDGPTAADSRAESRVIRGEDALLLAEAISSLPVEQAEAIRLRHLESLPVKEIAIAMGKSPPAIAGLLQRGTKALRERLRLQG